MPYEPDDYLSRHFQTSGIDLADKVDELVTLVAPTDSPNLPLYRDMLITVIRMAQADRNRWDAKIMLQTLREMEHAFSSLEQSPYSARPARRPITRCTPWPASSAPPWRTMT